jgi:hypothetical protein
MMEIWPIVLHTIALTSISLLTGYMTWLLLYGAISGPNSNQRDKHDD